MVLNYHKHEKVRITEFNDSTVNVVFTQEVKFIYSSQGPPSSPLHHTHSCLHAEGLE